MLGMLLCAIIVLCLSALYVSSKKAYRVHFDTVTDYYLYFVLAHALFALTAGYFFSSFSFAGLLLPFELAYGPFFYLGLRSFSGEPSSGRQSLHFIPFFVIAFVNLALLYGAFGTGNYQGYIFGSYYLLIALSLAGYGVLIMVSDKADIKKVSTITGFCLAGVGLLFAAMVAAKPLLSELTAEMIAGYVLYTAVMLSVMILFGHKVQAIAANTEKSIRKTAEEAVPNESVQGKYAKSGLSMLMLKEYKNRLDRLFGEDHTYLDNDLTLVLLAKKLKMPAHHLTQVFNVYIGENFSQYVNKYRVEYACMVLADADEDMFIEDVAYKSGFNSKVSFNRHFKNIMGCTPKEYVYETRK